MKLLNIFNRPKSTRQLVKNGLAREHRVSDEAVDDCIYLMASAMGEKWDSIETEPAAGMALITLVKNASLNDRLSHRGWELVSTFVHEHPHLATKMSPRARAEIQAYEYGYCSLLPAA